MKSEMDNDMKHLLKIMTRRFTKHWYIILIKWKQNTALSEQFQNLKR